MICIFTLYLLYLYYNLNFILYYILSRIIYINYGKGNTLIKIFVSKERHAIRSALCGIVWHRNTTSRLFLVGSINFARRVNGKALQKLSFRL